MHIETEDREWKIKRLTPQQILDLLSEKYAYDRDLLLKDLNDAGVGPKERLEALSALRQEHEMVTTISRLPFSALWSREMIALSVGEDPTLLDNMDPQEVARIAFWTIGQDLDELMEQAAEGNSEATEG
jgi:hypothetical protein